MCTKFYSCFCVLSDFHKLREQTLGKKGLLFGACICYYYVMKGWRFANVDSNHNYSIIQED